MTGIGGARSAPGLRAIFVHMFPLHLRFKACILQPYMGIHPMHAGSKRRRHMAMAETSTIDDIEDENSNDDILEVFKSAITSILSDDGLTVPTEGVKLCLEMANNIKKILKILMKKESPLLNSYCSFATEADIKTAKPPQQRGSVG